MSVHSLKSHFRRKFIPSLPAFVISRKRYEREWITPQSMYLICDIISSSETFLTKKLSKLVLFISWVVKVLHFFHNHFYICYNKLYSFCNFHFSYSIILQSYFEAVHLAVHKWVTRLLTVVQVSIQEIYLSCFTCY